MKQLIEILASPDNSPIVLLLVLVPFFLGVAIQRARRSAAGLSSGLTVREAVLGEEVTLDQNVHVWPYLVRIEALAAILCTAALLVWSIQFDAPLELPADPNWTPNPSKAPWYFQGLQELLVYFDAWIAGVLVPLAIVLGLIAIPYVDINPRGNGYYTWRERRFAVSVFSFGFLLWIGLICAGTLARGPGWMWFSPGQRWDRTRVAAAATIDLVDLITGGLVASTSHAGAAIGCAMLGGLYLCLIGIPWLGLRQRHRDFLGRLGTIRYLVVSGLTASMAFVVLKIVLRLAFSVKYVLVAGRLAI